MNAITPMEQILEKIMKVREGKTEFKALENHVKRMDDERFDYIIARLKRQMEIVDKYDPKIRPAIDPMVSSELGIYRRLDDYELGELLNYPKCCIMSFSEEARFGIDRDHLKEIDEMDKDENAYAIILPSGFIPCSLKCKEAWDRKLIAFVTYEDYLNIIKLEDELFKELPHFHGAYDEYYEKIILKK